jgi:hypothetical protein
MVGLAAAIVGFSGFDQTFYAGRLAQSLPLFVKVVAAGFGFS